MQQITRSTPCAVHHLFRFVSLIYQSFLSFNNAENVILSLLMFFLRFREEKKSKSQSIKRHYQQRTRMFLEGLRFSENKRKNLKTVSITLSTRGALVKFELKGALFRVKNSVVSNANNL